MTDDEKKQLKILVDEIILIQDRLDIILKYIRLILSGGKRE